SGRDQVVHSCYCRQQTVMDLFGSYLNALLRTKSCARAKRCFAYPRSNRTFELNSLTSFTTKSSMFDLL
ncbi:MULTISPECIES: hypothetical protein, partial [unclassified Acinetobacter]|uniref:hypothetical protein n=1 Tax=unclassified Acinetobacter TaxID=196816 RepID=UPI003AF57E1C